MKGQDGSRGIVSGAEHGKTIQDKDGIEAVPVESVAPRVREGRHAFAISDNSRHTQRQLFILRAIRLARLGRPSTFVRIGAMNRFGKFPVGRPG